MTLQERIIVSAYTGILMCDFHYVHEYIEKVLGIPVFTNELVMDSVEKEIKEKSKQDFMSLCGNMDEKCQERLEWEATAIQKQIPKRPRKLEKNGFGVYYAECPVCCSGSSPYEVLLDKKCNYCPSCGQRIDWS